MQYRRLFFRIFYGSIYFLLYVVLIGLLLVTPGDAIERSRRNTQNYNIWIVTIAYVVTVVAVCFVYALRLYVSKTVVASIPKAWVPIEKGDVKDVVHKLIGAGLNRSAAIAYEARPRVQLQTPVEDEQQQQQQGSAQGRVRMGLRKTTAMAEEMGVALPPHHAVWGEIEHYGWASPNSVDLPNLQYSTVLSELPNLIEAKALTLAPQDLTLGPDPPALDPAATGLLQRLSNMSLREYIDHLADLGVIRPSDSTIEFVSQYEYARFSNRHISNTRFRELMHLFAELLRDMQPLDFDNIGDVGEIADDWAHSESDMDNDAPFESTPRSRLSRSVTASTNGSVRKSMRNSSANAWSQYRTAPNTPGSRRTAPLSRQSSNNSFAQTRRPYVPSQPSSSSLRSRTSNSSGSVIRLATREDPIDFPYVLSLRDTAGS